MLWKKDVLHRIRLLMPLGVFLLTQSLSFACLYDEGEQLFAGIKASGDSTHYTYGPICVPVNQSVAFKAVKINGNDADSVDKDTQGSTTVNDTAIYTWSFGDQSPGASGLSTSHSYAHTGEYTVTLNVDDQSNYWNDPPAQPDTIIVRVWDVAINECSSSWLPTGNLASPSTTSIKVAITPSTVSGNLGFYLQSPTSYPGYCCNAGTESGNDLAILSQANMNTNPNWACTTSAVNNASVVLTCYDYGAWGHMAGDAMVEYFSGGGSSDKITAHNSGHATLTYVTVPHDDNGNKIADVWTYNTGNATDDAENSPVGISTGDGLTRLDEYRGFIMGGVHSRTDPQNAKDIFIYDRDSLGLGDFTHLGLTIHSLSPGEWDAASRIVNYNQGNNQGMIYMVNGGSSGLWMGYTSNSPNIPNSVGDVNIYVDTILSWYPTDFALIRSTVIGHECAHAVDIAHHWNTGTQDCVMYQPFPAENAQHIYPHTYCTSTPGCATKSKLH